MKKTINGKRYDTKKCLTLGERDSHSGSGNYSGTLYLLRADDGTLLVYNSTNGQDCYNTDYMMSYADADVSIDDFDMTEEQELRAAELGLITIV